MNKFVTYFFCSSSTPYALRNVTIFPDSLKFLKIMPLIHVSLIVRHNTYCVAICLKPNINKGFETYDKTDKRKIVLKNREKTLENKGQKKIMQHNMYYVNQVNVVKRGI